MVLYQSGIVLVAGIALLTIITIILSLVVDDLGDATRYLIKVILTPFAEEIVYRAPILLFFSSFTPLCVIICVLSSIYFGYSHRKVLYKTNALLIKLKAEPKKITSYKVFMSCFFPGIVGLLCSLLMIKYQSLYYAVLFHFIYNFTIITMSAVIVFIHRLKKD
jgi:membrane protease YdiL (CAAX protease family)